MRLFRVIVVVQLDQDGIWIVNCNPVIFDFNLFGELVRTKIGAVDRQIHVTRLVGSASELELVCCIERGVVAQE